jgi:hypothetical protein
LSKRKATGISRRSAAAIVGAYRDGERNFTSVDISGVNLSGKDLSGATFYGSRLTESNLSGCLLTHVQIKSAEATKANLSGAMINAADLIGTDFSRADLTGTSLYDATMVGTNLSRAWINATDLGEADLTGARLASATLSHAKLCDLNVSPFCDERRLKHSAPSIIDHRTVIKSYHHPRFRELCRDCGVPDIFVEFMVDCAKAIDVSLLTSLMQSTFISYGGPDEVFAEKLYHALKDRGIVTFFFPHTATVGARIGDEVYRGIQKYDRVLLVCSRKSLDRPGVVNEIQETLDREARDGGASYLLPITLDDYVFTDWKKVQPLLSERVGARVIGDFRGTSRNKSKFDAALDRVINALKLKRP